MNFFRASLCFALAAVFSIAPYISASYGLAETNQSEAETAVYAYADEGSEVYFYDENKQALFIIPQTYCVRVLGREGDWLRVRYAEDEGLFVHIDGYCLADALKECEAPLENLYLKRTVTVTYTTSLAPPEPLSPPKPKEFAAAYYGAYKVGDADCMYVYIDGDFAYIKGSIGYYEKNELPQPSQPTFAEGDGGVNAALICALVLTFVAAAAIIVIYFTGKRQKHRKE